MPESTYDLGFFERDTAKNWSLTTVWLHRTA